MTVLWPRGEGFVAAGDGFAAVDDDFPDTVDDLFDAGNGLACAGDDLLTTFEDFAATDFDCSGFCGVCLETPCSCFTAFCGAWGCFGSTEGLPDSDLTVCPNAF